MDVINLISKVPGLPDAPVTDPTKPYQSAFMHYANGYAAYLLHRVTKLIVTKTEGA